MRRLIGLLVCLGAAAIHAEPLRITTWNLDFAPQESVWAADGERVARVASVLRSLNADIVLLQAVPDRQTCETLAALLTPLPYQVAACSAFTDSSGQNLSQVAILSKRDVAASWTAPWKADQLIAPAGGLAGAAIRVGAGLVVVYSVQLKNNEISEDLERDTQINILQREFCAAQLAQYAGSIDARLTNHAAAVIIAGSLNTNPDDPKFVSENTLRLLEEAGFKDAFNGAPLRQRITRHGNGRDPDATLDYVLAKGANVLDKPGILASELSGHLPVTCDLEVPLATPIAKSPPVDPLTFPSRWYAPLAAVLLLLFLWWWFGSRKRFYSPAQLGDSGVAGLLSFGDESGNARADRLFASENQPALSPMSDQVPATDSTDFHIQLLERRAVAAERRAARATEVVRKGLLPHLGGLMKDMLFRGVAAERARLIQMQQAGAMQVAELERRMVKIQMQLQSRLTAYERRIAELEREVSAKEQANRDLLAARSQMIKQALQAAQAREEEAKIGSDGVME